MNNIFAFYEQYIYIIIFLHIIFSLLLAYYSSLYLLQRFKTSGKALEEKDKKRCLAIAEENLIFKLLFHISLYKNNQIAAFLFIFLFNISIPFLGYFFTLWLVWYMVNLKYEKSVAHTNIINLDEFQTTFLKVSRVFGEGSLINLMNNQYVPQSKKIKALSILASSDTPVSLHIIKQTLTSTDDEVRMFGYAILNKTEKSINARIDNYLQIIYSQINKEQKDTEKIAFAAKELAFLYWELIYTELSHESLKNNFLTSAIVYAQMAKEQYIPLLDVIVEKIRKYEKEDDQLQHLNALQHERRRLEDTYAACAKIFTLMGRIYMYKKEYEKAKEEFTVAKELLPEHSTQIIPYLAEVYYITKKYRIVKAIINQTKELRLNAKLYPVVKQWESAS
jgi:hypothetical protein